MKFLVTIGLDVTKLNVTKKKLKTKLRILLHFIKSREIK